MKHTKKIQVELTNKLESTWTWRKVGAKQPKGELTQDLLASTAELGDEIWIEISTNIDGIIVEAVVPDPETKPTKNNDEHLERIGVKDFKPFQVTRGVQAENKKSQKARTQKTKRKNSKRENSNA